MSELGLIAVKPQNVTQTDLGVIFLQAAGYSPNRLGVKRSLVTHQTGVQSPSGTKRSFVFLTVAIYVECLLIYTKLRI